MDLVLERVELRRPLRTPKHRRLARAQRHPDRVARQPRAAHQLLDRDTTNEVLPAQLGPALHLKHDPSPGLDDNNRARLTTPPDTSATAQAGSNLNRRRGVSFPPAPTPWFDSGRRYFFVLPANREVSSGAGPRFCCVGACFLAFGVRVHMTIARSQGRTRPTSLRAGGAGCSGVRRRRGKRLERGPLSEISEITPSCCAEGELDRAMCARLGALVAALTNVTLAPLAEVADEPPWEDLGRSPRAACGGLRAPSRRSPDAESTQRQRALVSRPSGWAGPARGTGDRRWPRQLGSLGGRPPGLPRAGGGICAGEVSEIPGLRVSRLVRSLADLQRLLERRAPSPVTQRRLRGATRPGRTASAAPLRSSTSKSAAGRDRPQHRCWVCGKPAAKPPPARRKHRLSSCRRNQMRRGVG